MSSSTNQVRDLDADLALCAEVAAITILDHQSLGRIVEFARQAQVEWPAAIRRVQEAEDRADRLYAQLCMERDHRQDDSGCYD